MRWMKRFHPSEYDYDELPEATIAVHRHPKTRRLHRLPTCRAMKFQGKSGLEPMIVNSRRLSDHGEPCRFCFGN